MSKKNAGLLIVALIFVAVFAVMFTTATYAGTFPLSLDSQFAAYCAGTSGGTCSVSFVG